MANRRMINMHKAIILTVLALLIAAIGIAGCTSKAPQPVDYTNLTHSVSTPTPAPVKTVVKTVVVPGPTVYVPPAPVPPAPPAPTQTYEVQIASYGGGQGNVTAFYASVSNSAGVWQQLHWQINWYINGQPAGGKWTPEGSLYITLKPGVQYTVTADYLTPAQWPNVGSVLASSAPYYVTG